MHLPRWEFLIPVRAKKGILFMKHCDILIDNCSLLTGDYSVLENRSVAINGNRIAEIGKADEMRKTYSSEKTIFAKGKLAMPGFVDGHTHLSQQMLRGQISDEYPIIYRRFNLPYESKLTGADTALCAKLAAVEMIHSGITSFADAGCTFFDEMAESVAESGLRASLTRSTSDLGNGLPEGMYETTENSLKINRDTFERYNNTADGRIKVWFQFRSLSTCSPELIKALGEESKKLGTRIHTHLSEYSESILLTQNKCGMRECEYLESLGVFDENLHAAHGILLSESELTLLKNRGVTLAACPRSNLGKGFPKTPRMVELGIPVSLGTDGTAHGGLNIFHEMIALKYSASAFWGAPYFDSAVLPSKTILDMALRGGAAAMGMSEDLGSIKEGKLADIILLDMNGAHFAPTHNIINTLTESAGICDVCDVVVNGKILMEDKNILVLDERSIIEEGKKRVSQIAEINGWN